MMVSRQRVRPSALITASTRAACNYCIIHTMGSGNGTRSVHAYTRGSMRAGHLTGATAQQPAPRCLYLSAVLPCL